MISPLIFMQQLTMCFELSASPVLLHQHRSLFSFFVRFPKIPSCTVSNGNNRLTYHHFNGRRWAISHSCSFRVFNGPNSDLVRLMVSNGLLNKIRHIFSFNWHFIAQMRFEVIRTISLTIDSEMDKKWAIWTNNRPFQEIHRLFGNWSMKTH